MAASASRGSRGPREPGSGSPIGTHLRVGRGLVSGALAQADLLGCEAIQIFAGNPRGWAPSFGDRTTDERFRSASAERGLGVFVHAPYLVNLGSPTPETFHRSIESVAHQLRRAASLGAAGLVVHTGSFVDPGGVAAKDDALMQVREGLLPLLEEDARPGGPWLLLEPTAGQGRSLCSTIADLGPYLAALDQHPRVGVCLDTCHVFASGAPLDQPGGMTATLDELESLAPGRLRLVHANDSKDPRGSLRDRHQRIGDGCIGETAFAELFAHPAMTGVPVIAETPGSEDPDDNDVERLRALRHRSRREDGP